MTNQSRREAADDGQPTVVLHIEDDTNDSELLRAAARRATMPILLENVVDVEEAIDYLAIAGQSRDTTRHRMPQLILVDLKLPGATGLEIVQWIRTNPRTMHIPVVVLSGSELYSDMQKAYDAGANSYVVKPLGFQSLVRLLNQLSDVWCRKDRRKRPSFSQQKAFPTPVATLLPQAG